jgi:hypothetical protein
MFTIRELLAAAGAISGVRAAVRVVKPISYPWYSPLNPLVTKKRFDDREITTSSHRR